MDPMLTFRQLFNCREYLSDIDVILIVYEEYCNMKAQLDNINKEVLKIEAKE